MAEREANRALLALLHCLDAELLADARCWLAGVSAARLPPAWGGVRTRAYGSSCGRRTTSTEQPA